jgi:hypothetical protein
MLCPEKSGNPACVSVCENETAGQSFCLLPFSPGLSKDHLQQAKKYLLAVRHSLLSTFWREREVIYLSFNALSNLHPIIVFSNSISSTLKCQKGFISRS